MRFKALPVHDFDDATLNFEQIQDQFGVPVLSSAPVKPFVPQMYFDSTLVKLRYWNGTAWVSL